MKKPYVSVIVCTYNGIANGIDKCLDSLLHLNYPKNNFEVIVVDDGSQDSTPDCLSSYKTKFSQKNVQFKPLINEQNLGLYGSKLRGVNSSDKKSEIIAVTDDDCEVHPDWLNYMVPHFENPKVGSVGGFIDTKNKSTPLERYAADQGNNILHNPKDARFFHGANCTYLKSALIQVGNFSQDTVSGGDAEISFKLVDAGFLSVYEPRAIVYHQHRTSLEGFKKQFLKYGRGDYLLLQKYKRARFTPQEMLSCFIDSFRKSIQRPSEDKELFVLRQIFDRAKCIAWFSGFTEEELNAKH